MRAQLVNDVLETLRERHVEIARSGQINAAGLEMSIETGKLASLAAGAVVVKVGDTVVLSTVATFPNRLITCFSSRSANPSFTIAPSASSANSCSVDPRVACGDLLDQIRNANTTGEAWPLVHVHWYNCVLAQERNHIGEYPQNEWNAFLKSNGIREQPIPETGD